MAAFGPSHPVPSPRLNKPKTSFYCFLLFIYFIFFSFKRGEGEGEGKEDEMVLHQRRVASGDS